jgi:presenilin-like A22 family membrane protease
MRSKGQYFAVFIIFIAVQLSALAFAPVLYNMSFQAFDDPSDPVNPLIYIVIMIGMTIGMLLLIKFSKERVIRTLFMFAVFVTMYSVFLPLVLFVTEDYLLIELVPTALSLAISVALFKRPEWYIIDVAGFILALGATAVLGVSFGILPALILLLVLAVYDAISVYKTKHMLTLAEGATHLRLPILFIVPQNRSFKMEELDNIDLKDRSKDEDRGAMMMGVGDAVIPGILVVSVAVFLSEDGNALSYSAQALTASIGALLGSFIGFVLLMRTVGSGKPQAGLPFLNGGAIAGFVLGYLLAYGDLTLGII